MFAPSVLSRAGLADGLCAEPNSSCQQHFLGSRRQRSQSPSSSNNVAACFCWNDKPVSVNQNSPRVLPREPRSSRAASPRLRSQSPSRAENVLPLAPNFGQDNVPLPPYFHQRALNPAPSPRLRGRPHRQEEEFDVDAYRSVRCKPEFSQRTPAPFGKDGSGYHDCNQFAFLGKDGKPLGNTRRVRSNSPPQLQEEGFLSSVAHDSDPGPAPLFMTRGPRGSDFRTIVGHTARRHCSIPGESQTQPNNQESLLDISDSLAPPTSPRDQSKVDEVRAAGKMSPRYERNHGLVPRSAEDDVFRAESKLGSRRHGYGSQASTNAPTPSNGSRDLGKGLSPEDTQLCIEAFLGERRRKAHGSPWASPGSSPFGSPPASPRQLSPPGTPPRGGASLSWDAIAPVDDGVVGEMVTHDSVLPTWSPRTTSNCRTAAVTMHRSGSPVSVGTPVVATKGIEEKFRGREIMLRKQGASKTRWR